MKTTGLGLLTAVVVLASTSAAFAEERFSLKAADGGYIRLDTQTGHTSICTGSLEALVCRSAPDERQALEAEIDRLNAEVARLKAGGADDLPSAKVELNLPSEQDLDKAMTFLEKMMKRFKALMDDINKDTGNQTPL